MTFPSDDHSVRGVAVVGCGHWGKNLVRNFAELSALAAICDPDPAVAEQMVARHGAPALTWPRLLADSDISAVVIAAPAAMHGTLTRAALSAGKHVFVEKPLALDLRDAKELCELAEQVDRRLMVGHLLQYHPAFVELRRLVRSGRLGRLQYLYSTRLNLGKFRREEDILWSFAPHDISMILSLVGTEPERVTAVGGYYLHKSIADVTTTHLSFPAGEQAHIFVSWLHPYKEQKLVVVGDRAMAVFDDGQPWDSKLLLYPHNIGWREGMPVPDKAGAEKVSLVETEPLNAECRHFLESIVSGERPRTDGIEGLRVLRALQAATTALNGQMSQRPGSLGPGASRAPAIAGVMIHETAWVDEPVEIGPGTKIWHFSHILAGSRIGRDVVIGQNVMIGPGVIVGNRCKIQNNVSLYNGVTLEDGVFCGPSCVFTNVKTPRAEVERKDEFRPTLVRRGATIGANATILCGTTLGENCFIGAGSVVTKDVPAHALMTGSPARRTGWMSHAGERLGPDMICPRAKRRYREVGPDKLAELTDE